MKTRYIALPLLFGAFPVLSLLAYNLGQVRLGTGARSLVAALVLSMLLLLLFRLLTRQWSSAALITAGLMILFFAYGHVYDVVRDWTIGGFGIGRHRFLAPLWGILAAIWVATCWRRARWHEDAVRLLLVVGAALVLLPTYSIAHDEVTAWVGNLAGARTSQPASGQAMLPAGKNLPDIYYIVLDAYGRSDVLNEVYGVDNSEFIRFLESRGFYVASQARSNYSQTAVSLASSLNMGYLDDLAAEMGPTSDDRQPLDQRLQHSRVRQLLESLGYQTIAFETGDPETEIRDATAFLTPEYGQMAVSDLAKKTLAFNGFEQLLAESTLLRPALDAYVESHHRLWQASYLFDEHRWRVQYTISMLPAVAKPSGPQFVFAHIISPHPPFVFGPNGQVIEPARTYSICDATCYTPTDYIKGYSDQVVFIDAQVEAALDKILALSHPTPIIIIQGDHGPAAHMGLTADTTNLRERMSILDAYLIPGVKPAALYPSITPVNSFRVVFNTYFGGAYPMLPDESYFSPFLQPYNMTRVTDQAKAGG